MDQHNHFLSAGWHIVVRHKRYIFWFWLLNLTLAEFGAAAFRARLHSALDRSLLADRLLHGFDVMVYRDMVARPEWGPFRGAATPAAHFALLFLVVTLLLMPGVLEGYTSDGRLTREEFFRACGRNVWRFLRLLLFFAIIATPVCALLFAGQGALARAAGKSTNERLPFYSELATGGVIFLVMTGIRAWFDLAQVDVVVRDQSAVRKSVAMGFRHATDNLSRLLGTYAVIFLVGLVFLAVGIWCWHALVPPSSVVGAFVAGQITTVLWLVARFWQRATAAALYLREMAFPAPVPVAPEPAQALTPGSLDEPPAPARDGLS
jgi:hypothetical protein